VTSGGSPGDGEVDAPAEPPARVRVTAPRPGAAVAPGASARHEASTRPGGDADDATDVPDVYVRSLIRSQLRLAVICAVGFAVATALFVVAVVWAPGLDESLLAGVPVSWLLIAVGVYPLALTIAALYVRAATRNEARYRSLVEDA
jgi:putative solute:sodium symporter small subunit